MVASGLRLLLSKTRRLRHMMRAVLAGTIVLGLAAGPAVAQDTTAAQKNAQKAGSSSANASADHTFVMQAAKGGLAEVQLGQLAADKASSDEVKKFGQRMADDHSKANDELKTLAQSKNITLPSEIGPEEKALRDRLMKLSGPAFDQAYMKAMVSDHVKDVNEFKLESKSGKD